VLPRGSLLQVLGAEMLLRLPESMQHDPGFRSLVTAPHRIVEQLLMNTQIELASTVLQGFDKGKQASGPSCCRHRRRCRRPVPARARIVGIRGFRAAR